MNAFNRGQGFALATILMSATGLIAEEANQKNPFVPNYMAVEEVNLSSPNGKSLATLKKGTLVAARKVGNALDVKTEDGKFGLSEIKFFSPLGSTIKIEKATKQVSTSSNQFAFDLYQQVRQQNGNLFFSPASISTALAMTYAGAGGRTEREMAAVLHFDRDQNVHEGFSTLLELLNSTGDRNGYSLSTANRLWGAKGYRFEDVFVRLTREQYRAELQSVDFEQPEQARQTINAWVEEQTRDKIVNLIPSGILRPDTRLVLTNAIYFEGGWSSEFPKEATKDSAFHFTASEKTNLPTMSQRKNFLYAEDDDAQILSMPYRGDELSMIVVLPKKIDGLAELEGKLTSERFAGWIKKLKSDRPVETYLPKFKMRSEFLLSDALKEMGMKSAFSPSADFSRISNSEKLMISEVIHQAFVDVDEKGTEAAAATAVGVVPTSAKIEPKEPPKPIIFRADHPYLFVIRDNRTEAVLFMGRMQRPDETATP